ncbi:MAG: 4-hydroxythreonine-4-phosphate dehydrogenase PdxA [Phycisphaerae bacterium]|nr:4-hydroxythreonine-4-phosphate dehydrogenase PdxA [Phycisphaerae bacterium]
MESVPRIAISMGDPGGIGPEIIVKALADPGLRTRARFRVFGSARALEEAAEASGVAPYWWNVAHDSTLVGTALAHRVLVLDYPELNAGAVGTRGGGTARTGRRGPTRASGAASFLWVEDALAECLRVARDERRCDALVTAPISKEAWSLAGRGQFPGHTELLATKVNAKRCGMLFTGPTLNVILATIHLPLMDVRNVLTIGRVFDAIDLGNEGLKSLGVARPRIAVCGLNPHAGENGLLGDEEARVIAPAIRVAQEQGIDARGPFPGDAVFVDAAAGRFDLVVAMYHDQGLIPAKLLDRGKTVNVTVGLPVVRTSPAHGTAFDIAGRNRASAESMTAAVETAIRMAGARQV